MKIGLIINKMYNNIRKIENDTKIKLETILKNEFPEYKIEVNTMGQPTVRFFHKNGSYEGFILYQTYNDEEIMRFKQMGVNMEQIVPRLQPKTRYAYRNEVEFPKEELGDIRIRLINLYK